jgi:hypothetical protein
MTCTDKAPLIELDEDGRAAILNYNLPQSTTYDVVSFIKLDFPRKLFKKDFRSASGGYWQKLEDLRKQDQLSVPNIQSMLQGETYTSVKEIETLGLSLNARSPKVGGDGLRIQTTHIPVKTTDLLDTSKYMAEKIVDGFMPIVTKRISGKEGIKFVRRPKQADPCLYMVMHMKMASYLGDYGAGQTIKTFSLLPGETTTISLKTYESSTETSSEAQSVLDSYSENTTDELQTTIENSTNQTSSFSETDTDSMSVETEASGGVNLGIVEIGGSAGGGLSSVNTTEEAIENQIASLENAVDSHSQTVDTKRQVEVNTETTSTTTSGSEQSITRSLENINRSRVLNFVFRQLQQEYFTLTYLNNVSFIFDNGFPHRRKKATISSIGNLLRTVMVSADAAEKAENRIYEHLCNIPDHTGTQTSFIEKVKVGAKNCINPDQGSKNYSYIRKRFDLSQSYADKAVKGIILGVKHRIMRTPSVIVDALLGQGEALDCYNSELQSAANKSAHLENDKSQQAIDIISNLSDAKEQAELYQAVFGDGEAEQSEES